jgi:hypothetical protein
MDQDARKGVFFKTLRTTLARLLGPPVGTCPLCSGPITEVRRAVHFKPRGGGCGWVFRGGCSACDVDFDLSLTNGVYDGWRLRAPERSELTTDVTEDELMMLSKKLGRYHHLGENWERFLVRRRAGDEVRRYRSADGVGYGFAVVRGGQPISQYLVFVPL